MCDLSTLDEITACTARSPRFPSAAALAAAQEHVDFLALDVQADDLADVAAGSRLQLSSAVPL